MAVQKAVGIRFSLGVPGEFASDNNYITTVVGMTAETAVNVGGFAWRGSDENKVKLAAGLTTKPLGLVVRDIVYPIPGYSEATLAIAIGGNVTVAKKGDFFVKTLTNASIDQKVYASPTDGSIKTGATGATITGYVETDYTVATVGSANDIIAISNH